MLRAPHATYLILSGGSSLAFATVITINLVYQTQTVGLNPLQLVLVGTVLEGAVFIGEVPTGIVADVYSRRLSVIIGLFLTGIGFLIEGLVPAFGAILVAQIVWGIGFTFISGAKEAWIADEIGEKRAARAFLRGSQASHVGALVGIGLSVLLASMDLKLAIVGGGILYLTLGCIMILIMPETGFKRSPRGESTWTGMIDMLRSGTNLLRTRPALITIFTVTLIFGMFSEGYDRLWTPHLLSQFTFPILWNLSPVIWFGIISAGSLFISLFVIQVINRKLDTDNDQALIRSLMVIHLLIIGAVIGFALTSQFALALAATWIFSILRGVKEPITTIWMNRQIGSKNRATVLSMNSQADAVGQIGGGPVLGVIATVRSIPAALITGSALLVPILFLFRCKALTSGQKHCGD
ncbi:MAG: MFS transporter [Candidatus Latescibacteria bacterium]|nr:MFS transporter [Candidatus Latescibacterota bacterium]